MSLRKRLKGTCLAEALLSGEIQVHPCQKLLEKEGDSFFKKETDSVGVRAGHMSKSILSNKRTRWGEKGFQEGGELIKQKMRAINPWFTTELPSEGVFF